MGEPVGEVLQRRQGVEQIATDTRRRERREAPLRVNRQDASGFLQGNSLNPFHDQRRLPVDEPAAVQARKGLQSRKAPMRLVLSIERRPRNTAPIGRPVGLGERASGLEALDADKPHAGLRNAGRRIPPARRSMANGRCAGDRLPATRHGRAPLRSLS